MKKAKLFVILGIIVLVIAAFGMYAFLYKADLNVSNVVLENLIVSENEINATITDSGTSGYSWNYSCKEDEENGRLYISIEKYSKLNPKAIKLPITFYYTKGYNAFNEIWIKSGNNEQMVWNKMANVENSGD